MFLPHPRVKVSIVGSLRDREVACSASDRQGSNFEPCVWRTVSSQSSHHPQEVLLARFSLYVHKGGLKPDSLHFYWYPGSLVAIYWNRIIFLVSTPMFSGLMIRMWKNPYWNIIMADLNKIQDGHRRNVLCYCIEDMHMIRKHSFVYLNTYMLLPYQPVIKFESWYPMFTI